jgi:hypothetical protein
MDNCQTHTSDEVRKLIEDAGAKLVYLPPYTPEYNPIEHCFFIYKAALKRAVMNSDITDVYMAHLHCLNAVTDEKARHEFRHVGYIQNVPEDEESEEILYQNVTVAAVCLVAVYLVKSKKRRRSE